MLGGLRAALFYASNKETPMKIHYKHPVGGGTHEGPSGTTYEFLEDDNGRRVADVDDKQDIERFLSIQDADGNPLFVALRKRKAKADPSLTDEGTDNGSESGEEGADDEGETQSLEVSDQAEGSDETELESGLNEPETSEGEQEGTTLEGAGTSLEGTELN